MLFTKIQCASNYHIYPCISQHPILEPKNKFSLFLSKNFLEKLNFYLRIFFQVRYGYTQNLSEVFFYLGF